MSALQEFVGPAPSLLRTVDVRILTTSTIDGSRGVRAGSRGVSTPGPLGRHRHHRLAIRVATVAGISRSTAWRQGPQSRPMISPPECGMLASTFRRLSAGDRRACRERVCRTGTPPGEGAPDSSRTCTRKVADRNPASHSNELIPTSNLRIGGQITYFAHQDRVPAERSARSCGC